MKHLFLPYELALLAKEKGFNEGMFYADSDYGIDYTIPDKENYLNKEINW